MIKNNQYFFYDIRLSIKYKLLIVIYIFFWNLKFEWDDLQFTLAYNMKTIHLYNILKNEEKNTFQYDCFLVIWFL